MPPKIPNVARPLETFAGRIPERINPVSTWKGFAQFLSQYGVLTLAIGVVIGTAVNQFVQALVADIVTPLISLITPNSKLQDLTLTYHHAVFKVGLVLDSLISLLIVAFLVYFFAKVVLNNDQLLAKK